MILYHGSNRDFTNVDLSKSRDRRDFGRGFYTTTMKEQAQHWGHTMFNCLGGDGIFLYEFEFEPSPDLSSKELKTLPLEYAASSYCFAQARYEKAVADRYTNNVIFPVTESTAKSHLLIKFDSVYQPPKPYPVLVIGRGWQLCCPCLPVAPLAQARPHWLQS